MAEEGGKDSKEREARGKGGLGKSGEELGRALTKSFRYNLVSFTVVISNSFSKSLSSMRPLFGAAFMPVNVMKLDIVLYLSGLEKMAGL